MIPTAITVRNYRSFPRDQRLELKPLTLLYGTNNAGKSALLRTLPLVADSIARDGLDALNLGERLEAQQLDFDSLRWKGRSETDEPTIGLTLTWSGADLLESVEWALWEEPDWHRIVVQELSVRAPGDTLLLRAKHRLTRGQRRSRALSYKLEGGDEAIETEFAFSGLAPNLSGVLPPEASAELAERLATLSSSVLWLRALRPAPQRYTRWTGGVVWDLRPDGSDAPMVLSSEPDIRNEVSSWYEEYLQAPLVIEEVRPREVRVALWNYVRGYAPGYQVDLIDTGEGLSQVLSVLTALAMVRRHRQRGGPSIAAIEEPEAHLHPDLQTALAVRVCEVAADSQPRIVLETHSEHILLAVQREVVKKRLSPDDVILYWVRKLEDGSSVAEPVRLDEAGRFVGNWPPDAFEQDLELAAEIQDAREGL